MIKTVQHYPVQFDFVSTVSLPESSRVIGVTLLPGFRVPMMLVEEVADAPRNISRDVHAIRVGGTLPAAPVDPIGIVQTTGGAPVCFFITK